jgi:hypothetical protein
MKTIKTRTAEYAKLEERIFLCRMIADVEVNVEDTNENLAFILKISEMKPYAVLVDARVPVTITKEAMENAARPEFHTNLIAQAILVNSLANRIVGNFIIKFHKPGSPTKLFSNYDAAMDWLRECVQQKSKKSLMTI